MSAMFGRACKPWVLLVFLCRPVMCHITGPTKLNRLVGEDVSFKWSTNDKSTILSATWGIKKANIPDPQYINVDIRSSKAYINSDLKPDLIKRLSFDGDLKEGRAWFTLKNVTINDTNEYIADISDGPSRNLPYTVLLNVTIPKDEIGQSDPTGEQSHSFAATPSLAPKVHGTTTAKETQVNASKNPHMTANPDANGASTRLTAVLVPLLVLVILAFLVAIFVRKKYKIMIKRKSIVGIEVVVV